MWVASVVLLLLPLGLWGGGSPYYAVVVRSAEPLDYLSLQEVEINGQTELGELVRNGPLTNRQYDRLSRLSFEQLRSFRVSGGVLQVQLLNGGGVLALPREYRGWTRTYMDPETITKKSQLKGKLAGSEQTYSSYLIDGWVVYLFSSYPGKDAVAYTLAETKNTEEAWSDFLQRFPQSSYAPRVLQMLGARMLARAQAALDRYRKAMQDHTAGYSNLKEARSWVDKAKAAGLTGPDVSSVEKTVAGLEADISNWIQRAQTLSQSGKFDEAEGLLQPILPFRQEIPELQATLDAIRKQRTGSSLDRAQGLLAEKRYAEAVRALDEAAAVRGETPDIARLRNQIQTSQAMQGRQDEVQQGLAQGREASRTKNYDRAFDILTPLIKRYPNDQSLRAEYASLLRVYTESLLDEAAHVEESHTPIRGPADEKAIIEVQQKLDQVTRFNPTPAVAVWRDRLGLTLADYYRARSVELTDRNGSVPSPLAFAYLQQARHFLLNKSEIPEFSSKRDEVERNLRIGVLLTVRDLTPEANGADLVAQLSTQLGATVQQAAFPHVEILDRSSANKPTIELVVELLYAGVQDDARAEQISSEYAAGTRQVPNPKWREAKTRYDDAVDNYEKVRARVEANRRRQSYSEDERRRDDESLRRAESDLDRARKGLDAMPAFVEEPDFRPYELTRRTLTRTATLRLAYRWVNTATGVREDQQLIEDKESADGTEVTGVQPGDSKGNRNQSANLPDASTLRTRVLRKIQNKVGERTVGYLKSYIARDYERAQQEASRGNQETAAEYYLRFLYNSPADDQRRQQALDYLEREFRFVALGDWLAASGPY